MKHNSPEALQFQGFLSSASLWTGNTMEGLKQFQLKQKNENITPKFKPTNLRLGKWVERLVIAQLNSYKNISILAENIQIQNGKITIGELDLLILNDNKPIHLEIVYKFYLYDKSVGESEIDHWIGPNRKDSFNQKLDKLCNKQLPLLYNQYTTPYLSNINLEASSIEQQVYFKAQLFVPLKDYGNGFPVINNDCITGFYIYPKDLNQFSNSKFYIPSKHNWLITPHTNVSWLSFPAFKDRLQEHLNQKNAPLYWLKKPNGQLFKLFVVWW